MGTPRGLRIADHRVEIDIVFRERLPDVPESLHRGLLRLECERAVRCKVEFDLGALIDPERISDSLGNGHLPLARDGGVLGETRLLLNFNFITLVSSPYLNSGPRRMRHTRTTPLEGRRISVYDSCHATRRFSAKVYFESLIHSSMSVSVMFPDE